MSRAAIILSRLSRQPDGTIMVNCGSLAPPKTNSYPCKTGQLVKCSPDLNLDRFTPMQSIPVAGPSSCCIGSTGPESNSLSPRHDPPSKRGYVVSLN
ncbi:hypothetical protein AVEN_135100-1 [Araneus ventricosus]|uniref:Uncharacterized protein n=1 Tax=Araneus ventricosus TaxID=182803 RepID=A0A4Y2M7L0_ARAVE|nr:hypothetical protein AVEN_135100-1 [Araneus ventricosus]